MLTTVIAVVAAVAAVAGGLTAAAARRPNPALIPVRVRRGRRIVRR